MVYDVLFEVASAKMNKGLEVWNGPLKFQVLANFFLCLICLQNLDGCSLFRARKIFAITRMLELSFKFARLLLENSKIVLCSLFGAEIN